jgi:hypothetical protein
MRTIAFQVETFWVETGTIAFQVEMILFQMRPVWVETATIVVGVRSITFQARSIQLSQATIGLAAAMFRVRTTVQATIGSRLRFLG